MLYVNIHGRDITTQKQVEIELRVAKDIAENANKTESTFLANESRASHAIECDHWIQRTDA